MSERIPFLPEFTGERQSQAMQAQTKRTTDAVNARGATPIVSDEITFTAGQTQTINHLLGRQPTEWTVTDVTSGYGSFRRTGWNAKTITIQAENACTARFRVA